MDEEGIRVAESPKATPQEFRFEPERYHLEDERFGKTWKLKIGDLMGAQLGTQNKPPSGRGYYVKAYVSTGEYPDGALGEVFISPDKEGSFAKGVLDGFALLLSITLQHGIPLENIINKFMHMRFEPSGYTNDDSIPMASSFFDLMFRKLALEYLDAEALERLGIEDRATKLPNELEDLDGSWKKASQRPSLSGAPFNQVLGEKALKDGTDAPAGQKAGGETSKTRRGGARAGRDASQVE